MREIKVTCDSCHGSGKADWNEDDYCPVCFGNGEYVPLPDNPLAYDCSKMTMEQLLTVKNRRPDTKGWNEYDYAEFGAYREAVRIEIEKRNKNG